MCSAVIIVRNIKRKNLKCTLTLCLCAHFVCLKFQQWNKPEERDLYFSHFLMPESFPSMVWFDTVKYLTFPEVCAWCQVAASLEPVDDDLGGVWGVKVRGVQGVGISRVQKVWTVLGVSGIKQPHVSHLCNCLLNT